MKFDFWFVFQFHPIVRVRVPSCNFGSHCSPKPSTFYAQPYSAPLLNPSSLLITRNHCWQFLQPTMQFICTSVDQTEYSVVQCNWAFPSFLACLKFDFSSNSHHYSDDPRMAPDSQIQKPWIDRTVFETWTIHCLRFSWLMGWVKNEEVNKLFDKEKGQPSIF